MRDQWVKYGVRVKDMLKKEKRGWWERKRKKEKMRERERQTERKKESEGQWCMDERNVWYQGNLRTR